jgi:hypothetical protein
MIYWGEVCPHGNQAFEAQQRQQGNICVNLASRAMFHPDECPDVEHEFKENDVVAIIDCQSFVPEYIPVIRALEQQEQDLLPFDDGVMLNLNANRKADLTNTVLGADAQNKAAAEGEFQRCILQQFGYQDDSLGGDDNDQASTCVVKTVTKLPLPLIEKLVSDMISSSVRFAFTLEFCSRYCLSDHTLSSPCLDYFALERDSTEPNLIKSHACRTC